MIKIIPNEQYVKDLESRMICHFCEEAIKYKQRHYHQNKLCHKKCADLNDKRWLIANRLLERYETIEEEAINPDGIYNAIDITIKDYNLSYDEARKIHKMAWGKYNLLLSD